MATHVSHSRSFFPREKIPIDTFQTRHEIKLTLNQWATKCGKYCKVHDNEHDDVTVILLSRQYAAEFDYMLASDN